MTAQERFAAFAIAERAFIDCMHIIVHEPDCAFADKEAMVATFKQVWPIFGYNCTLLQDALDWINPAYQGMTKYRSCGERFYRKEGAWYPCADGSLARKDTYLHVKTQVKHVLEYAYQKEFSEGFVVLDTDFVHAGKVPSFNQLPEIGINQLLLKIGALPF